MEIFGTLIHWFSRGGLVMYLLLACSILSVTIIIERFRYYRSKSVNCNSYISSLDDKLAAGRASELMKEYAAGDTAADIMVAAGLKAVANGRNTEAAMEAAAQLEAAKLKKGLPILSMIVTLSPILGLMGTVIGMIQSFSVFNMASGSPTAITGGVGEALIATATGLAVAVIALVGHSYYSYRLDGMMTTLENISTVFEERMEQVRSNA